MNRVIRTFFFFSKRERIGVLCLLSIIIAFLLAPQLYAFFKEKPMANFAQFDQAIALLKNNTTSAENNTNTFSNSNKNSVNKSNKRTISLFHFNPNTISKDSLLLLGLSPKMTNTISNYRNKGGKFFRVEDFKKIYGISEAKYQELLPYIDIPSTNRPRPVYAKNNITKEENKTVNLAPFDPNIATEEELQQLGLSKKVSSTFVKFRAKGGYFYKKEDVKKIYGLSEEKFQEIAPFINIKEKKYVEKVEIITYPGNSQKNLESVNIKKSVKIDINKASPAEWENLYGIGPAFAKRITNFRNKLGGFVSIDQVAETYGIPDSTFQQIRPSLVHSPLLSKIPINTCDAKTLSNHPYIRYQVANSIIAYRNQHGTFKNTNDLKEIRSIDKETLSKITPYLSID